MDGQPVQHGWRDREETARDKVRRWMGERGGRPGTRVVLLDEETGAVLADWPGQR
ncbi:hypothetical protein [Streptomyces sp. enrichment culture]|uniref:hypothetical protein n=1 Tax=Streptomyces sp. enrichment culture TaxID=1795815 RepID=UPI003F54A927